MGTKDNPGKYDCEAAALHDEPKFTLLARDPQAPFAVDWWADERFAAIQRGEKPQKDIALVQEARECAQVMREWREKNDGKWRVSELRGQAIEAFRRGEDSLAWKLCRQVFN